MSSKFFHLHLTLEKKLSLTFICVVIDIVVVLIAVMAILGINGREERAVHTYTAHELSRISEAIYSDFASISLEGTNMAKTIADISSDFFKENKIKAREFKSHPELIEPLLNLQFQVIQRAGALKTTGAVFTILDATINSQSGNTASSKAGLFLIKSQPAFIQATGVRYHFFRGPSNVAHTNKIGVDGRWRMEFDVGEIQFFDRVMKNAEENKDLQLSRLYLWTERHELLGRGQKGLLLCVPLIADDGTVFGVCGFEMTDTLFKTMYQPNITEFSTTVSAFAQISGNTFETSKGLISSNYYLTGRHMTEDLNVSDGKDFREFTGTENYRGDFENIKIYPNGSVYENEKWAVAVLIPTESLKEFVKGNSSMFYVAVAVILVVAIIASIFLARFYMNPVNKAFDAIKNNSFEQNSAYLEINDLFEFLANKDKEHEKELEELQKKTEEANAKFEDVQSRLDMFVDKEKQDADSRRYQMFMENIGKLTKKERQIFDMYISGFSAKDIVATSGITENTLKFHNKNIYSKLGISSRKELMLFAKLMTKI